MSAVEPQETADFAESTINLSRLSSVSEKKPVIPGYTLGEKLGQGAFGAAYRAVQEKTGQSVCVKVLTRVGPRFREEVDRLSQVSDHPHIVTLVDADLDHAPPYLVTPLLSGNLRDEIPTRAGDARLPTVCRWFEELATALEFVHGRGILHCDLKPANVLIDEKGFVRLTDFGQAALQNQEQSHLGSFWFMPRQQAGGDVPEIRWDIYALGATVYALLTGRPPRFSEQAYEKLESCSSMSDKLREYRQIVQSTPVTPVRNMNPAVDPELAAIVEHCLDSENGYPNATEVLGDLDRWKKKMPLSARPYSNRYVFERFVARHRLSFVVGVAALSILLTGLSVSSYEVYQARQARRVLIEQQFEVGRSLLKEGQTTGLVWLARAYETEPREEFRAALLEALSQQRQIAHPFLYRLRTMTPPSPSGRYVIWKNRRENFKKYVVDLRDTSLGPLPEGIFGSEREQKDQVRYRLDGIELNPIHGSGGPATWRIRPTDSLQPGEERASVAILVRPDKVWRAQRSESGIEVLDNEDNRILHVHRQDQSPVSPTFSNQGDFAVSWEDGQVDWYRADGTKMVDKTFYGDLFCFSDDGRYLAVSDGISRLRVWNTKGEVEAEFPLSAAANELCFNKASTLIACVTRDGLVHGFSLETKAPAWPPLELQKPAEWVMIQKNGQLVTMSDEAIVWKEPEPLDSSLRDAKALSREVARRTGWIFDERSAQIRTLSRSEYQELFSP